MSNKADRGTKHICQECEAPFYDLNRTPVTCPMCGVVFKVEEPEPRPVKVVKPKPVPPPPAPVVATTEDAAEDSKDAASDTPEDELAEIETDNADISTDDDDNTFLETEEDDTDVSGMLGTPVTKGNEET